MTETLDLVIAGGVLVAAGTVLLMARPLTRIVLGTVLLGNGVNLLLLSASGAAGRAPLLYATARRRHIPDPLPQAFVLTAIVITLALTAFLVTMAYRAWQLYGTDDVQDDVEDIRVARRAERVEARDRLRAEYRERRLRERESTGAAEDTEAAGQAAAEGKSSRGPHPVRDRYRHYRHYREARRRARTQVRAELRAHRAHQARAEEGATAEGTVAEGATAEGATEENDPWATILGGDR